MRMEENQFISFENERWRVGVGVGVSVCVCDCVRVRFYKQILISVKFFL